MMHNSFSPYFNNMGIWPGIIGMVFNVIIIIGVVLLVVWTVKKMGPSNSPNRATSSTQPLSVREILDMRYARGELSRDEYQVIRQDILEESS